MPKNFAHLGGLSAYEVLGIEPTATTAEIEAAYRAAIKRQHSDTGGVTRLAQLVNDARDALVNDRASYDAWLQARPRGTAADSNSGSASAASNSSRSTWSGTDDVPDEEPWDPWETVRPPQPPPKPTSARSQPTAGTDPGQDTTFNFAEARRSPPEAPTPLSSGLLDVVAAVLAGPLGSRLGIRSSRRGVSAAAGAVIVIGGMSVLALVSLAIAISLGLFSEPSTTSPSPTPTVMKQGQVVVTPGTKVVLDKEGTSFAPSDDHATFVATESGLLLERGTSYVALGQKAPERYDTCSALAYPEPVDKPIAWNRLTIGSSLCVRTTSVETTKSLITVVDRSGRSATLQIITWND